MKILVLGGSGGVGQQVITQALERGHVIRTIVRPQSDFRTQSGVEVVRGELLEGETLGKSLEGVDAVLCSVGMKRKNPKNPFSSRISQIDLTEALMKRLVAEMLARNVPSIIAVSAAGVGESEGRLNILMKFFLATTMIGDAYRDLAKMEKILAASSLDWLAPRPTRLEDGPKTGQIKCVEAFGLNDAISRADVAFWMLEALEKDEWPHTDWGSRTPQITGA